MKVEKVILNQERNVTLTAYIQQVEGEYRYIAKRPAVLILPGGGYQFCSEREADPVAFPYLKAGYQVFILRYSVGKDAKWPTPLNDYEEAVTLIRSNTDLWKVYEDKIAVLGFSAGGHLAAAAATMSKNRPNAAILGYAVAGEDVKGCNESAPDTISHIDADTCPCFVFATRTDNVVPIDNSIRFISGLAAAEVSFESHIYAYGPHGFSTCDTSVQSVETKICSRVPHWVEDSIGWLRDMFGEFGEGEMEVPRCKAHATEDGAAFLSVDCTMMRIMGNPEGNKIVAPLLEGLPKDEAHEGVDQAMEGFMAKMCLRGILEYMSMSQEAIEKINQKLQAVPNI